MQQWGDHLVSLNQTDTAINHFIEAGKTQKAIESAISAKQWKKAVAVIDTLQANTVSKANLMSIARHFSQAKDYPLAEKYFCLASRPQEAVEMYTRASKWDKAHSLAKTYMSQQEVTFLYVSHARDLESQGRWKDAEKLYLTIGEPDLAINMYKNHKMYEHMIRLVSSHHKDLLVETHLFLAKSLEGICDRILWRLTSPRRGKSTTGRTPLYRRKGLEEQYQHVLRKQYVRGRISRRQDVWWTIFGETSSILYSSFLYLT